MDAVSTKVVPSTLCGTLTGQHSKDQPNRALIDILTITLPQWSYQDQPAKALIESLTKIFPQWSWRWRTRHNREPSWSSTMLQDRPSGEWGWVGVFISVADVVVVVFIFQQLPFSSISKKVRVGQDFHISACCGCSFRIATTTFVLNQQESEEPRLMMTNLCNVGN